MYHIYSSHPIAMNPFKSAFAEVFTSERDAAAARAGGSPNKEGENPSASGPEHESNGSRTEDGDGREQLVWVLWKILKGDGVDVSACIRTCRFQDL